MQCVHENFLSFIGLVLNRLPADGKDNLWAQSLQTMLIKKAAVKKKSAIFSCMHKNCIVLTERIRKLCKGRVTVKQLSAESGKSESEILESGKWELNQFWSPFWRTLLIMVEDVVREAENESVAYGMSH